MCGFVHPDIEFVVLETDMLHATTLCRIEVPGHTCACKSELCRHGSETLFGTAWLRAYTKPVN